MKSRAPRILSAALAAAMVFAPAAPLFATDEPAAESSAAPAILWDKPAKIVEYQLKRLNNKQLEGLARKPDDSKYKPAYTALLTRKGIDRKFRQEAVDALAKLNKSDAVVELLNGIGKADPEDKGTLRDLVAMLSAQKPAALKAQRDKIQELATTAENPTLKQVAFGALATADGGGDQAWELASKNPEDLKQLLAGLPLIADAKVRGSFYAKVQPLATKAPDEATQAAAVDALGSIPGHEAEAFKQLAEQVKTGKGAVRAAAVRSVGRIPAAKWPKDQVEALAKEIVKLVEQIPGTERTKPEAIQAVQLGNDLSAALPTAAGAPIRKSLRDLGVRVVLVHTFPEMLLYDVRYFTVQAGKPVQVVLQNTDTMPHNFVITAPGALQEVADAGAAVPPMGNDPKEKAFVPNSPKVLQSTPLVQPDEAETLSFNAPDKPGEYPFVCTFPGHAQRMYGVMQVVPDLDAYDKDPKPPADPFTKQPLASPKNDPGTAPPPPGHEGH